MWPVWTTKVPDMKKWSPQSPTIICPHKTTTGWPESHEAWALFVSSLLTAYGLVAAGLTQWNNHKFGGSVVEYLSFSGHPKMGWKLYSTKSFCASLSYKHVLLCFMYLPYSLMLYCERVAFYRHVWWYHMILESFFAKVKLTIWYASNTISFVLTKCNRLLNLKHPWPFSSAISE